MLLEVGRVDKAHGLRGEVIVKLTTNVAGRLAPGAVLYTDAAGTRSLHVTASQPHHHRWIVRFRGLDRREDADELHGVPLFSEPVADDDPDTLWVHELIGAEVVEGDGTARGRVVSVIDNPASDLLELESGALVPLRFVVSRTSADGDVPARLVVDPPAGLFDT